MATDKRSRQREQRTRLEEARRQAEQAAHRRRRINLGLLGAAIVVAVGLILYFTGSNDDQKVSTKPKATTSSASRGSSTTVAGQTTTSAAPGAKAVALTGPGPGEVLTGDTPCPKADGSSKRTTGFKKAPPTCIDPKKTYTAAFDTTKGSMVVALDAAKAPKTVNNFVVLSRYHFYDGSPFFRIVKDFAAQFGDPSAQPSNRAQFGYTIPDELPKAGEYKVGSLAMANTGQPDSGGAQVFLITGPQGVALDPKYALFGQVTQGLDVLTKINESPSVQTADNDGAPTEQITITKITISES